MSRQSRRSKQYMINKRAEAYSAIYEKLEDGASEMMLKNPEIFHLAFESWKAAARECNLQYRKGRLYTGNNRFYFPLIYMPKDIIVLPDDMGGALMTVKGGYWITGQPQNKGKEYFLELATKQKADETIEDFFLGLEMYLNEKARKGNAHCIKKATFDKLIDVYAKMLVRKVGLIAIDSVYSGWQEEAEPQKLKYKLGFDTILNDSPNAADCVEKLFSYIDTPLSSMLCCATLFSISKPLLSAAKLPTDFLLRLAAHNKEDSEESFYYRHKWTCYFCNPNDCKRIYKNFGPFGFEQTAVGFLSPAVHHNFPQLYHKGYPDSTGDEGVICFSIEDAKMLKKMKALPILLSPIGEPAEVSQSSSKNTKEIPAEETTEGVTEEKQKKKRKKKPFKGCLTLTTRIHPQDRDNYRKNEQNRRVLFDFYSGFLQHLSEDPQAHILAAKKYYPQALKTLCCTKKNATEKQTQIACFLTALHLAEDYIKQINPAQASVFLATKNLLEDRAKEQLAQRHDFAAFLQELASKTKNQFPLLMQDDSYLYLDFKGYWKAFEEYCKSKDIPLQESEKGFRRAYLVDKFLKPQYTARPGTYSRYDCRKLIGTEKKTVLVVKKEILRYSHIRKDLKVN